MTNKNVPGLPVSRPKLPSSAAESTVHVPAWHGLVRWLAGWLAVAGWSGPEKTLGLPPASREHTLEGHARLQAFQRMPKLKTDMAAESAAKEDARPEPDTFFTGIRSVTLMLPALGTG